MSTEAVELLEYTAPEPKKTEPEAAGVEFLSDVNVVDDVWRWVYLRDPFGILLELVEIAYRDEEAAQRGIDEYVAAKS